VATVVLALVVIALLVVTVAQELEPTRRQAPNTRVGERIGSAQTGVPPAPDR
jgi:Tfp pilus assembly protein PilX